MKLQTGNKYNLSTLHHAGWTGLSSLDVDGYNVADYFAADGSYLGPDQDGVEPLFAA